MTTESDPLRTAWADDLFLHGVHLARWIVDYVDLEESLAVGTLAQEQLAHARELLIAAGLDAAERDRHLCDRPATQWAPSRLAADPIETWPRVVVVGLLLTHATLAMLAEAEPAENEADFAARVAGIVAEQHLHLMHWQRWTVLLAGSPTTREELLDTLRWAGELAADLLGELGDPHDLSERDDRDDARDFGATRPDAHHSDPDLRTESRSGWLARARARFAADVARSLADSDVPARSLDVDQPRCPGEHAVLIQAVLAEQRLVRARYPDPVLEPL